MAYNFKKKTCDKCGAKENKQSNYYQLRPEESFRLGFNGEVWCAKCHKEKELESLFNLMDARDKRAQNKI